MLNGGVGGAEWEGPGRVVWEGSGGESGGRGGEVGHELFLNFHSSKLSLTGNLKGVL